MAREISSRKIRQGHRNHQRQSSAEVLLGIQGRHDRGFGIQRVEDRFDENEIHSALDQCIDLLAIHRSHLVEINFAETRIVDAGRQRQCFVGRPIAPATQRTRPSRAVQELATSRTILPNFD